MSRVLDEHRFDALAASVTREDSEFGAMLLDRDLRIRGLNATYEAISVRQRNEILGEFVFDVFPDDPNDPQASGSSQLAVSVESAMRRHGTDTMPIVWYDITDPHNPDVFGEVVAKVQHPARRHCPEARRNRPPEHLVVARRRVKRS